MDIVTISIILDLILFLAVRYISIYASIYKLRGIDKNYDTTKKWSGRCDFIYYLFIWFSIAHFPNNNLSIIVASLALLNAFAIIRNAILHWACSRYENKNIEINEEN